MPFLFYNDFSGGENNTTPPDNMNDNEVRKMENAHPALRGGFEKRLGTDNLNATSYKSTTDQQVTQVIEWVLSDGSTLLLNVMNNDLNLVDQTTGVITKKLDIARSYIGYIVYKDVLYFTDGSKYYEYGKRDFYTSDGVKPVVSGQTVVKNTPISTHATKPGTVNHFYKALFTNAAVDLSIASFSDTSQWSDVTASYTTLIPDTIREVVPNATAGNDLTPIKRCKYLAFHPISLRVFAAGDSSNPSALYYSESDDPTYFKAVSILYPTSAMGPVNGVVAFNRSILVGYKKRWRVWNGTDPSTDAEWKELSIPVGLIANDTIALTPESLTFQAGDGHIWTISTAILADEDTVMVMSQGMAYNLTEEKQKVTIDGMVSMSGNKAVYHDGKYLLAYSDDAGLGYNNKVLELTWQTKAFSKVTGWRVNCWCERDDNTLLFGSTNYILEAYTRSRYADIDTSDGSDKAISMSVDLKPTALGTMFSKFLNQIFVSANQYIVSGVDESHLDIEIVSDYTNIDIETDLNESFVWGRSWTKTWGWCELIQQWAQIRRKAIRFQAKFTDSTEDNPIFIYGMGYMFDVLDAFDKDPISAAALISNSV
ncbi:MAG: hypothetical protein SFH39_00330 [Candidatus Magnetobacterium sp. LHC-1]